MSPAQPVQAATQHPLESRIDEALADFAGDARATIAALLLNRDEILRDADKAASVGYLRGRFSQGARAPIHDEGA